MDMNEIFLKSPNVHTAVQLPLDRNNDIYFVTFVT